MAVPPRTFYVSRSALGWGAAAASTPAALLARRCCAHVRRRSSVQSIIGTPCLPLLRRYDAGCMGDQPIANASLPMADPSAPPLPPECELPMA